MAGIVLFDDIALATAYFEVVCDFVGVDVEAGLGFVGVGLGTGATGSVAGAG